METKHSSKLLTDRVAEAESSIVELLRAAHYTPPTKSLAQTIPTSKTIGGGKKTTKKVTPLTLREKHTESNKPSKHQHPLQEFEGSSRAIVGSLLSEPGSPHMVTIAKSPNVASLGADSLPLVSTLAGLRHTPYAESDQTRSVVQHYNRQLQEALKAAIMTCLQQLHCRLITAHEDNQSDLHSLVNVKGEAARGKGEEGKLTAICFTLGIQFFIPHVAIHPSLDNLCSAVEECTALVVGTSGAIDCWDYPSEISTAPSVYSVLRKDEDIRGMQRKILVALRGE